MSQQLTLGLSLRDDATFDNYFAGKNESLIHTIKQQTEPYVYLFGAKGTGKTHILQAACHYVRQQNHPVVYLPLSEPGMMPAVLDGLESMSLIVLDDIQAVLADEKWEQALFNLYNRVRDNAAHMIVSAELPLTALNISLPDLRSRLGWGPVFQLLALSDNEKKRALQDRAKRRGLALSDDVVLYLLKHCCRDMSSLFLLLDKLDQASLAEKRKLTIPFVKRYL